MNLMKNEDIYSNKPAQGVFWIPDIENLDVAGEYCFRIYSEPDGTILLSEAEINSKSGKTFNHKKLWENLPDSLRNNKLYNYYPRGRVQIRNGRAVVYLNPEINTMEVQEYIIGEFGLQESRGIKTVRFVNDGSEHYQYYQNRL